MEREEAEVLTLIHGFSQIMLIKISITVIKLYICKHVVLYNLLHCGNDAYNFNN